MRKTILITGASSGLGEEMARQFAARGHDLALCARRTDRLEALKASIAAEHPDVRVIVHPECPMPVVDAADSAGSTDHIRRAIEASTEPTTFAIGTEINLVQRLAAQHPQHTIFCLDPVVCPCSTMFRIDAPHLCWVLEELVAGRVVNQISVDPDTSEWARVALQRMLEIV